MVYVVAGVSGKTGAVVADTLLEQGKKVRVVARDPAKVQRFAERGAQVAAADLTDVPALTQALAGAEGAYLLAPPNMVVDDFKAYQRQTVDALVAAVKAARVPHVVLLSSVGAQHPDGTGPIAGLHRAEGLLRALPGTRVSFLRAAYFMENLGASLGMLGQGLLPSFFPADKAVEMVATADIGKLGAALLVEGPGQDPVVELASGRYSMKDVAAALSRRVGKTVQVTEAPLEAVVPTFTSFGMKPILAEMYREMIGAMLSGRVVFEGGHRRVNGGTSLDAVLAQLLPPA